MRFNDKELMKLCEGPVDLEGLLHHMRPQENDWSDWYQQPSFKERLFKLVSNLLFYFRVNETEPVGLIVLENAQVAYERPHKGIPFAFSLTFKDSDKNQDNRKHIFSCRCQDDVNRWVATLKMSSYEHWRSQCTILKTKICMRTGKDPVLEYIRSRDIKIDLCGKDKRICAKKSTFQSHLQKNEEDQIKPTINGIVHTNSNDNILVGKLIDI